MFLDRSGLHIFTFRGIDVLLSFWYGFLMALVVFLWPSLGAGTFVGGVILAIAITISLLIHDFGHAFVAQHYKLKPTIILHAFGGFTLTDREAKSDGDDARVLLAGPFVGLIFAGLIGLLMVVFPGLVAASPVTSDLFSKLFTVSLVWSLVNLFLPIYPLDGGRLFHLLMRRFVSTDKARRIALNASIFTVIPVAIIGFLQFGSLLVAIFALYVIMDNAASLKSNQPLVMRSSGHSSKRASSFHEDLLEQAQEAIDEEDWREAARLGHHMRAVGAMPEKMMEKVWMILGVATTEMGEYEEAMNYLKRAPKNSAVKKAIERCEGELDETKAAG